jgi:hypothetical protein
VVLVNVAAIIVTKGDVDLSPIVGHVPIEGEPYLPETIGSLPAEWERLVWDNSAGLLTRWRHGSFRSWWRGNEHGDSVQDLSVYGRYAAIAHALDSDLIYVQDDDCILPPESFDMLLAAYQPGHIAANMPERFRPHYPDSCLVGFGAIFDRELPSRAFGSYDIEAITRWETGDGWQPPKGTFHRTCDVVFTILTPRILIDAPVEILDYAHGDDRMWKQPTHVSERARMLALARRVRDQVPT